MDAGYVKRTQLRDNGKMSGYQYEVSEICADVSDLPFTAEPFTDLPFTAETTLISTESITTTKFEKTTESLPIVPQIENDLFHQDSLEEDSSPVQDKPSNQPKNLDAGARASSGGAVAIIEPTRAVSKSSKGDFEAFWQLYPKRLSRGTAEAAYAKAIKIRSHDDIIQGVYRAIQADRRFKDKQFTPLAATWLNARGYDDEHAHHNASQTGYVNGNDDFKTNTRFGAVMEALTELE